MIPIFHHQLPRKKNVLSIYAKKCGQTSSFHGDYFFNIYIYLQYVLSTGLCKKKHDDDDDGDGYCVYFISKLVYVKK